MTTTTSRITPSTEQDELFKIRLERAVAKQEARRRQIRARRVKGLHLLEKLPQLAKELGFDVEEMAVFHKITGKAKDRAIYVSRRGGRVDLAGFSMYGPAFSEVSREEAKRRHLGRVKARMSLTLPDDVVLQAYKTALEELN